MIIASIVSRLTRTVIALAALAVLITGCTLASPTDLIADDATATPLPDTFGFFSYQTGEGGYVRTSDNAAEFKLDGMAYVGTDGLKIRLVPYDGSDNRYLMGLTNSDGHIYGLVTLHDEGKVAEIRMVMTRDGPFELQRYIEGPGAAIAGGVTIVGEQIQVTSREALDDLLARIDDGTIPTSRLIGYIGPSASSPPPATISIDGDTFKAN